MSQISNTPNQQRQGEAQNQKPNQQQPKKDYQQNNELDEKNIASPAHERERDKSKDRQ